jgi:hypothetical protein
MKINKDIVNRLYNESSLYTSRNDDNPHGSIRAVDLYDRKEALAMIGIKIVNDEGIMIFKNPKNPKNAETKENPLSYTLINRKDFLNEYNKSNFIDTKTVDFIEKIIERKGVEHPYYTLANKKKSDKIDNRPKTGIKNS